MGLRVGHRGRLFALDVPIPAGTLAGGPFPGLPLASDPGTITSLLSQWREGDPEAFPRLVALAYDDLKAIAHRRLRGGRTDDLATTALVHEAYLKLMGSEGRWESRAQFYAFASRAMRHILVDHARREQATKRGGDAIQIPFEEGEVTPESGSADVLGVDEAVEELARRHPNMARVVELRFFGGLSVTEVAEVLETSPRTVEREWTRAKAYLRESLADGAST
jgi:RNA polymerase sigma factor (TIGR02999 family)